MIDELKTSKNLDGIMRGPLLKTSHISKALLAFAVLVAIPACQKAKMKTVPREDAPRTTGPRSTPPPVNIQTTPPPNNQNPPNPNPVVPPSRVGEGGPTAPAPQPTGIITSNPTTTPVPVVQRPATVYSPSEPVRTRQPDPSTIDEQPVRWMYGGQTLLDLDACSWDEHCNDPVVIETPEGPVVRECRPIQQPEYPITNKLDVIFVVDTSSSIDIERQSIARNIDRFIDEISRISQVAGYNQQIDYRMAVILAHGPNGNAPTVLNGEQYRSHGLLFVSPNEGAGAQPILGGNGETLEQLKTSLEIRFNGGLNSSDLDSVRDRSDTQGEAGLLALQKYLETYRHATSPGNSAGNQVFPRPDAGLMVAFISDENDVCYDYNHHNNNTNLPDTFPYSQYSYDFYNISTAAGFRAIGHENITSATRLVQFPAGSSIERDVYEHNAFVNECEQGQKGNHWDIVSLLEQTKNWQFDRDQNLPILATGVLYRTQGEADTAAATAAALDFRWFRDKERGMGYLNVIHAFHGQPASLLSNNFGDELALMGKEAAFRMTYQPELELIDSVTGQQVNLSQVALGSIRIKAINPDGTEIWMEADQPIGCMMNAGVPRERHEFCLVYDTYPTTGHLRLHRDGMERKGIVPGSTMVIYYQDL